MQFFPWEHKTVKCGMRQDEGRPNGKHIIDTRTADTRPHKFRITLNKVEYAVKNTRNMA